MEDRDYLELLIAKVNKLEKSIDAMMKTMEEHKLEHGFDKMKDGGVNRNFGSTMGGPMGGPPGMGGGMDRGYGMPGMGAPMSDPSMPPGV
jgi:hypothetical protein|tara:strand:+ start:62 stop:331 length:270 start_codon:yes stop_codon:yes gene_type:complete